jgi:hypothetical protein
MAKMTVPQGGALDAALLKERLELIKLMYEMAEPSDQCFRQRLSSCFYGDLMGLRDSFIMRLAKWIFVSSPRKPKMLFCCDACNEINSTNYLDFARQVMNDG